MTCKRKNLTLSVILIAALCFCACGKKDSEKLSQESTKVLSWVASAELIFESWSHGSVPDAYARRSLKLINQELGQNIERLQSVSDNRRPQIISNIEQIQVVLSQIASAVEHEDRSRRDKLQAQLADLKRTLASIVSGAPETP
jgi:DNA anti-recombination protein RmuC